MRDEKHLNDLLDRLHTTHGLLKMKRFFANAENVDEAATQLRILFDDVEDLATRVAELTAENDRLREDLYYTQDRLDEAHESIESLNDTIRMQQEDL